MAGLRHGSAGSHPKVLHPNAVRVLAERGIDISDRETKHLRRFARSHFDDIITLCDRVREVCPEFGGHPQLIHWSIADPAGEADVRAAFRRAAALTRAWAVTLEQEVARRLPDSAVVDDCPADTAVATASKYPTPTSRW